MWYFAESINDLNLIQGMNRGRKAAMNAENLVVNDDAESEEVKHVRKIVPYIGVSIFARAFSIEAI